MGDFRALVVEVGILQNEVAGSRIVIRVDRAALTPEGVIVRVYVPP